MKYGKNKAKTSSINRYYIWEKIIRKNKPNNTCSTCMSILQKASICTMFLQTLNSIKTKSQNVVKNSKDTSSMLNQFLGSNYKEPLEGCIGKCDEEKLPKYNTNKATTDYCKVKNILILM